MDEFGVLTEKYGLKPQGKAAPMASSKRPTNITQTGNFGTNPKSSQFGSRSFNSNNSYNSFLDDHSSGNKKTQHFGGLDDDIDIFGGLNKPASGSNMGNGGSFDYDPIFMGSNNGVYSSSSSAAFVDDIFGGMKTPVSAETDHGFSAFTSPPKQSVLVDDLLDKIGGLQTKSKGPNRKVNGGFAEKGVDFDDLIPGFGVSNVTNNGATPNMNKSNKPTVTSHDDPFLVFETASSATSSKQFPDPLEQISKSSNSGGTRGSSSNVPPLRSPPKPTTKVTSSNKDNSSGVSSIDELEKFAMGRVHNNASKKPHSHSSGKTQNAAAAKTNQNKEATDSTGVNQSKGIDDLESIFGMGSRSSSVPKSRTTTSDHTFDGLMQHKGRPEAPKRVPSGSSASMKKSPVMTSFDDLSLLFDEASPSSAFEEIEGEPEERRKARLGRYQRTQERAAKAVADLNQRDLQSKMEQAERHRIAEIVNAEIKRWTAGKEGNMRALLSTLQYVLWPECGWQPVSLTDMITSASVKRVYRKATLCIHPDKVQQKGATLEQKYRAEKIFDILKEASTKFNAEELY
ncbi:hypothetical protein L6164_030443 [Bauhinia variegata]|uniref:Uncharacterized protein n=1 Tax=Bauhinia variegata TaxID=167791 RepID=A0ACB9LCC9_BAUVA|nr:hypothetical protein L6164_030443 [Bauhinia variegata]